MVGLAVRLHLYRAAPDSLSIVINNPFLLQIYEEVSEGAEELDLGGSKVNMRAYCTWFNFKGSDQQKKLSVLSGGERNRLQLAKVTAPFHILMGHE